MNLFTAFAAMPGMDGVMKALPYMGYGMVGIFFVTGLIILTVSVLNKATGEKKKPKVNGFENQN